MYKSESELHEENMSKNPTTPHLFRFFGKKTLIRQTLLIVHVRLCTCYFQQDEETTTALRS